MRLVTILAYLREVGSDANDTKFSVFGLVFAGKREAVVATTLSLV